MSAMQLMLERDVRDEEPLVIPTLEWTRQPNLDQATVNFGHQHPHILDETLLDIQVSEQATDQPGLYLERMRRRTVWHEGGNQARIS